MNSLSLSTLANTDRPRRKVQRVGRGMGSRRGKTSCRGIKGDKARRGYARNFGREGGARPLYRILPCRGFPNARFQSDAFELDFDLINEHFKDGEVVNYETLRAKGLIPRRLGGGIRVLSTGELTKKCSIEAHHFSKAAVEKLEKKSVSYKVLTLGRAAE
ncbi:MAG: 50S ribosomal protein L15 [Chlamydiales bacterium]|nr:50S ribosomal protein L15 [Chlamydiales bacterium]